jgi:hypothetical protein
MNVPEESSSARNGPRDPAALRFIIGVVSLLVVCPALAESFLVWIQVDEDLCGSIAESDCDLSFTADTMTSILGAVTTWLAVTAGFLYALGGKDRNRKRFEVFFVAAAAIGLILYAWHVPFEDPDPAALLLAIATLGLAAWSLRARGALPFVR